MSTYENAFGNRQLTLSDGGEYIAFDLEDSGSSHVMASFRPSDARQIAAELNRLADVLDPQQPVSADAGKGSFVGVYFERGDWGKGPTLDLATDRSGEAITSFDDAVTEVSEGILRSHASSVEVVELAVVRRAVVRRTVEVLVA